MGSIIYEGINIEPSKVVCVGRNYVEHIAELGNEVPSEMVIFNKPSTAIGKEFKYFTKDTRFEGEISFVIGDGKIAGVGFGFDLTHADIQNRLKEKRLPWERAKAFDNSALFSHFVAFGGDINSLRFILYRNDTVAQEGGVELMIYKPLEIVEEIKSFMTLNDGDIIMSGTPKGVSTYNKGDRFTVTLYSNEQILLEYSWIVKG